MCIWSYTKNTGEGEALLNQVSVSFPTVLMLTVPRRHIFLQFLFTSFVLFASECNFLMSFRVIQTFYDVFGDLCSVTVTCPKDLHNQGQGDDFNEKLFQSVIIIYFNVN